MQAEVDRVMHAYGLIVPLSLKDQAEVKEHLQAHLSGLDGDENALAIEGLRFLRKPRPYRRRSNGR